MTLRLTVMASGRGSNFEALHDAIQAGACDAEIACVVSDRRRAPVLERAQKRGLATAVVPFKKAARSEWDAALTERVRQTEPEWVVLAGFMRVLSSSFIDAMEGRVINVHPSLLPAFPGMHAVQQALDAGVRVSGCTVHLVDGGVDTGPILAQSAVPVQTDDDADALHGRIRVHEHRLLPGTIDAIAKGRLAFDPIRWREVKWPNGFDSPCVVRGDA